VSPSKSPGANWHTVRCASPVSVVWQCKLVSGWGIRKRRSAPPYGLVTREGLCFYIITCIRRSGIVFVFVPGLDLRGSEVLRLLSCLHRWVKSIVAALQSVSLRFVLSQWAGAGLHEMWPHCTSPDWLSWPAHWVRKNLRGQPLPAYTKWSKKVSPCLCHDCKNLTYFRKKIFTETLSNKLAIKWLLWILPHLGCIATLFSEMLLASLILIVCVV